MAAYIKEKYDHTCQYQWGGCTYDRDLTIDHIVPISLGGSSDDETNLTVACRTCNGKKKDKQVLRQNYIDDDWLKA